MGPVPPLSNPQLFPSPPPQSSEPWSLLDGGVGVGDGGGRGGGASCKVRVRLGRWCGPSPNCSPPPPGPGRGLRPAPLGMRGKSFIISMFAMSAVFKHIACARHCAKFLYGASSLESSTTDLGGRCSIPRVAQHHTTRSRVCSSGHVSVTLTAASVGG